MPIRGVGGYQIDRVRGSRSVILDVLGGGGWVRYSEIVGKTGLSTATVSKHLKRLEEEACVEKKIDIESGEYPYPVSYRILPEGEKSRVKLRAVEILNLYQISDEYEFPENMLLLSNVDLRECLPEETRTEIGSLLGEIESAFFKIHEVIRAEHEAALTRDLSEEERTKIEFYFRNEPLHHSLDSRYAASGVVRSQDEDENVKLEEEKLLRKFDATREELEANPYLYIRMNRLLKGVPLTFESYQKYGELQKKIEEAAPIVRQYSARAEEPPQLCVVLYTWGLESMFSRYQPS